MSGIILQTCICVRFKTLPTFVIKKIYDGDGKISVEMVNILMFKEKKNSDLLKKVVKMDTLSVEWRDKLSKRL